jgi:transposase
MDAEDQSLRATIETLRAENERLRGEVAALRATVEKLTAALEEARRGGKRQAAPFRKTHGPKLDPQPPGRKSGEEHGTHCHRLPPKRIDEKLEAPLPAECPHCGSRKLRQTHTLTQYQTEIPRRPIQREFTIHVGECRACQGPVQGRHPLQTSNAVGAAGQQLGSEAHAALAILNKELGLSHGKCAKVLEQLFGVRIARATSARSLARTARRSLRAHRQIRRTIRGSPSVTGDETGWRIGGKNGWLHVLAGPTATLYRIARSRDHTTAQKLLRSCWSGILVHDGWAPYERFVRARHQQCLAHLLRRCRELIDVAVGAATRFPRQVKELLQGALALRDRRDRGEIGVHGLAVARGRLARRLECLVRPAKTNADNERLEAHLENHLDSLFTFLEVPGLDATNWRAEQAIRPAVVNRKVWGGNRTIRGAVVQGILTSVLRTLAQRRHDSLAWLAAALRSTKSLPLPAAGR